MEIMSLLSLAKSRGASDLHLVVDNPPLLRINGLLQPIMNIEQLSSNDIDNALTKITTSKERADFEKYLELDFGYTIPDVGRVRCNAAKQRGTTSLVIRLIPLAIPTIDELNLPEVCKEFILKPRGLVIVSGPTGSGKSTTIAAMINHLNNIESRRLVTIEDPIEYLYSNIKCTITQRELGTDTTSFAEALRHVLRQDPDVILVGEIRDFETAAAVLATAETGHLVLTTGHAPSAPQAIERVIDLFTPHERPLAQTRLASLIVGVIGQTLVPKSDGSGRVAAVEVMLGNPPVKNLIREGKIYQLSNVIRTHANEGMLLLDQALLNLHRDGLISSENLFALCNNREEVAKLIDIPKGEYTSTQP